MSPISPENTVPQSPLPILQGEALFWSLFRESSDVHLLLETKTLTILDLNPAAEKVFGYSREELLNRCFSPALSETQRMYVDETQRLRSIIKTLNEGKRFTFPKSDGIFFTAEGRAILVSVQNQTFILIMLKTGSEKRKHDEQLRQMEKLMAIGQMVAGVAHEINNPLTVIKGRLDLLKLTPGLPEKVNGWVKAMDTQLDRVVQIVKNFLLFSRKDSIEKELVNMTEVVKKSLEFRRYELSLVNIEVIEDYGDITPYVMASSGQIEQVFLNLINNAYHAMSGSPGILRIKMRCESDMVHVTFTDSGPGISDDIIMRIFEPFFTTKDVGQGTGLGLSISYSIVQDHGGHLSVWNELGAGAAFKVQLPITNFDGVIPAT
ncbi:MAG: ATP-binding protein [Verrucomicrobiota bacterium]|nr:ATP-binding protein [Verrucomicrobiota bacterium]